MSYLLGAAGLFLLACTLLSRCWQRQFPLLYQFRGRLLVANTAVQVSPAMCVQQHSAGPLPVSHAKADSDSVMWRPRLSPWLETHNRNASDFRRGVPLHAFPRSRVTSLWPLHSLSRLIGCSIRTLAVGCWEDTVRRDLQFGLSVRSPFAHFSGSSVWFVLKSAGKCASAVQ